MQTKIMCCLFAALLLLLPIDLPAQTEAEAGTPLPLVSSDSAKATVWVKPGHRVKWTDQAGQTRRAVYRDYSGGKVYFEKETVEAPAISAITVSGFQVWTTAMIIYFVAGGLMAGLMGVLFYWIGKRSDNVGFFIFLLIVFAVPFIAAGIFAIALGLFIFLVALLVGHKFDLRRKWRIGKLRC